MSFCPISLTAPSVCFVGYSSSLRYLKIGVSYDFMKFVFLSIYTEAIHQVTDVLLHLKHVFLRNNFQIYIFSTNLFPKLNTYTQLLT